MKLKRSPVTSQILILMMAAVVLLLMVQVARAQTTEGLVAQASRNQSTLNSGSSSDAQIMKIKMPQKGLGQRLLESTSLSYYQQFLGPTADGDTSRTYNVFQEGIDSPGSGKAPLQSFHSVNLRHQINTDWAVGTTLSAVNGYTEGVENKDRTNSNFTNSGATEFFNARAYVTLPAWKSALGTLFTTMSYEHPTSTISKNDDMKWGWVLAQSFAFELPDVRWNAGLMGQVYRIYYKNNLKKADCPPGFICTPTALQTMIVSGGPYVNYRFNDKWMLGSNLTFDWDQRGLQSGSRDFNNNLSDRGRVTLTYFPTHLKYLQSVGLFTQALLKFRPDTTAIGADFAVRF
ncbi:MAG: hypothetical protein ACLGHN_07955 [Bacteriovoracia bacterium]